MRAAEKSTGAGASESRGLAWADARRRHLPGQRRRELARQLPGGSPRRAVLGGVSAAVLAWAGFPGVAWGAVTTTEGQAFSGPVAGIGGCALASSAIAWGDGSPASSGVLDGASLDGTHTYAEEGAYDASVSYTCSNLRGVQTASFAAVARDAPLSGAGRDSAGVAMQPLGAVVAHFTDANPAGSAGDFSVQIAWGDGSTTAGSLTAAPGGGWDVTGTHAYQTAGAFTLTSSISDLGGATTTAGSTARITLSAPPPPMPLPPPVIPPLAIPQARFGFAPFSPCQNDKVSFDASSSTGGGDRLPITRYSWSIDESAFAPTRFTSTTPTLSHVFPAASYSVGPYQGPLPNTDLNDYHFFRPPAKVTLQVTDSAGSTATLSRTITFVDPDELLVGQLGTNRQTGLPHLYLFRDARFRNLVPCQSRSLDPKSTTVKLARPTFRRFATLRQSGAGAAYRAFIAIKSPCRSGLVACSGELIVSPDQRPAARGRIRIPGGHLRGVLARSLGHATFFVPAGRSATVVVRLNARGRALARAHTLGRVTLSLLTSGPRGGTVLTSRTIIIVSVRGAKT